MEEDQQKLAENQDFTSRFGAATQQLSHEVAAVRLAGVIALAQLADEFEINRQMCIDGLCAYIRMPYDPKASSIKEGEKEVRLSIISEIVKRLQKDASPSWSEFNFDFSGATFDGGNFSRAQFSGGVVNFSGAQFSGGEVYFYEAQFSGGVVDFTRATFSNVVIFPLAKFSGGVVNFSEATFSVGKVIFPLAKFSGGVVNFSEATFSGGKVIFPLAKFSGGVVDFSEATFSGGKVSFPNGHVYFSSSAVRFSEAQFSGGEVRFSGAQFFGGEVYFYETQFYGGVVDFSEIIIEQPTTIDLRGAVGKIIEVVMLPNPLSPILTILQQNAL